MNGLADDRQLWQNIIPIPDSFVYFDSKQTTPLQYHDLLDQTLSTVVGVVEYGHKPVLYIVRATIWEQLAPSTIEDICHTLACRGHNAYVAYICSGTLNIKPCLFRGNEVNSHNITIENSNIQALLLSLTTGNIPVELEQLNKKLQDTNLRKRILTIFSSSARSLRGLDCLKEYTECKKEDDRRINIILSILGRVLFTCFLCDRGLTPKEIAPSRSKYEFFKMFYDAKSAAKICAWQDKTFNGDLLPLDIEFSKEFFCSENKYIEFFSSFPQEFFTILNSFANGERSQEKQLLLLRLLDFKHVPVGLLSEVYEDFAHTFQKDSAKETSVHYTPRHIAETVLDHAFNGIPENQRPAAKVLDPAVGAGVFLVLALQRLVQENVSAGKEPNTELIRSILYNQVRGLDINMHALRLSTLALYLAAIDLDNAPEPIEKLRFSHPLIGSILFYMGDEELGSLGPSGTPEHIGGQVDIVIGNPPWTKNSKSKIQIMRNATKASAEVSRPDILHYLKVNQLSAQCFNPNGNPVYPFLWRSLQWAREGGVIAFVLPAEQLLFREAYSRIAFFEHAQVKAVINGTDLVGTSYWKDVHEPFCLLFATNNFPEGANTFRYFNAFKEQAIVVYHNLRLDASSQAVISISELKADEQILKKRFRGTALDVQVIEKIVKNSKTTFEQYLNSQGLSIKRGYGTEAPAREPSVRDARIEKLQELRQLMGLHLYKGCAQFKSGERIRSGILEEFNSYSFSEIARSRDISIYSPPLILLNESTSGGVNLYSDERHLIYSRSFYGISLASCDQKEELLAYFYVIFRSNLFKYYALMTSNRYGVNRKVYSIKDFKNAPVIHFDCLSGQQKEFCMHALRELNCGNILQESIATDFVASLYNLNEYDIQVINDTIATKCPSQKKSAESHASQKNIQTFIDSITADIKNLCLIYESQANVFAERVATSTPGWVFFDIFFSKKCEARLPLSFAEVARKIADGEGNSLIFIQEPSRCRFSVGMLNQNRYWTLSQARLISPLILKEIDRNRQTWGL